MGSPFNGAKVELYGDFVPLLSSEVTFQDLYAISNDGQICFLIQWMSQKNNPGFCIWKIDARQRSVLKSSRIEGCCNGIKWKNDGVDVDSWAYDKGITTHTVSEFFETPPDKQFIFDPSIFKKTLHECLIQDMAKDILFWTKDDVQSILDKYAPGKMVHNLKIQSIFKELEQDGLIRIIGRDDRYLEVQTKPHVLW